MYKQNKGMLKVKNIKNTPCKLYHIHQCRGILRARHNSKMEISANTIKDIKSLTVFEKNSISEVWLDS